MKKFLVIGNPIEHSLSPTLHNYWIKSNSIDGIYEKQRLNEGELEQLILQIKKKKVDGVNVTVPFKKTIIPFLDELSIEAKNTQSVNTLYFNDNKVSSNQRAQLVLGADSVIDLDNELISKPESREEALIILKKLNGKKHHLISLSLIHI